MTKQTVRKNLISTFAAYHVDQWLAKFPDDHVFSDRYTAEFIDYINSMPAIPQLPEEAWTPW